MYKSINATLRNALAPLRVVTVWMPFTHPKSEADQTQSSHDLNQLCGLNTATIGFGGFLWISACHTMGSKLIPRKAAIIICVPLQYRYKFSNTYFNPSNIEY